MSRFISLALLLILPCLFLAPFAVAQDKIPQSAVKVKIQDEKAVVFEPVLPVDPVRRIQIQPQQNMNLQLTVEGKMMHLGHIYTILKMDDRVQTPAQAQVTNARLPRTAGGKERDGHYSVFLLNNLRITQSVEVVPT